MSGEIMETRMRATLAVAVLVVVYPGVAFAQLAPQSQAEFEQRFTGWTVQSDAPDCGDGIDPITFIEPGRFDVDGFFEGDYEYERTGANTGTLTVTFDILPIPQVIDLTFNSQTMGTFTVAVFGVACEGSFEFVESTPEPQTGEQIYYFPHLAVGASWQTTITYINYSPQEVSCQTEFLSDHGSPLMVSFAALGTVPSRTDVLPPGGSVHQETNVDLNASLALGWARATCSGPVQASLLYRLHNSEGAPTAEAGVNATAVPATRFVTFAEQGEDQFGTGVAYANPSAISVPVTFTARDGVGEVLASVVRTLSPGGHDAHGMSELFDLTSFTGSIEVTSTEPIVSLSINFEAAPVFSSLPPGELDASAQGSTTYYFPHLAVGEGWQTTITYINYSPQEVTCQTEFLSDHGSPLMVSFAALGTVPSRTDVLPPGGSVHQETNVDLNASLALGWARATCSGPVQASLLYRLHNSEGAPTAEAGVNATAVPATRFVTFAEQGEDQFGTGVAYANPSAISVPVTFTARDGVGEVLASVVRTLSPGGHDAHGMSELFDLSSFTGSLEITSTEPIVSLSINFEAAPVFSSLPPGDLDAAPAIPGEMPAPADDRAALEALYDATNGANWSRNDNWKTDEPLGQWFGVRTNSDGRVTRLDLSENQLSGTIPAEIGNLTSLTTLSISFNQLSGTIPVEIGNLTSLEHLLLGSNQLSGTIPAELGNLTRLISLGLENNQLSGTIPAEIGNLTSLFALRVDTDTGLCLAPDFDLTSPFATRSGLPVCSTEP